MSRVYFTQVIRDTLQNFLHFDMFGLQVSLGSWKMIVPLLRFPGDLEAALKMAMNQKELEVPWISELIGDIS